MKTVLLLEGAFGNEWVPLGAQTPEVGPVTISDVQGGRREVYLTQCFSDHAEIKRLPGGVDIEQGALRIIDAHEVKMAVLVKRLALNESHEMTIQPPKAPAPKKIRYRCVMLGEAAGRA